MHLMYINGIAVSWDDWPRAAQVDHGTYAYSTEFQLPWSVSDHDIEGWKDIEPADVPAEFRAQVLLLGG